MIYNLVSIFLPYQIDAVIRDSEKVCLLAEHTDQLLVMCSLKLRMTHGRHFDASDDDTVEEVLKCYRGLLATVISVSQQMWPFKKKIKNCKTPLFTGISYLPLTNVKV